MSLPPKAVFALTALKERLLVSGETSIDAQTPEEIVSNIVDTPENAIAAVLGEISDSPAVRITDHKPRSTMRHARSRNIAFQRACRRKDWFAPVY